jgi:hypothetical protein
MVWAPLFGALCLVAGVATGLEYRKVHVVDHLPGSRAYFFRGDQPAARNDTTGKWAVDFPAWTETLRRRAREQLNETLPPKLYLIDVTFENLGDGGFFAEQDFWQAPWNQDKGRYVPWWLLGAPLWPQDVSAAARTALIDDGTVWRIDQLPERVVLLRRMLEAGPPPGYDALVVYGHCAAGCDRTGEMVAAYRMSYLYEPTLLAQYEKDVAACGRAPSYFCTGMIGWYCLTWNMRNATPPRRPALPDCLTAYNCTLFGSCRPNNAPHRIA